MSHVILETFDMPGANRKTVKTMSALTPEALIAHAFHATAAAEIYSNAARKVVTANSASGKLLGYASADMIGRPVRDFYGSDDDWECLRATLNSKPTQGQPLAVTLRRHDGALFDGHVIATAITGESGALLGYREIFSGGADSVARETSSVAEWSESARLARGIAHDFNNLLAIIGGNVQLAAQRIADIKAKALLREAELACDMGARLTSRIKSFAAGQHLNATAIDVVQMFEEQKRLLLRMLGPGITLTLTPAPDLKAVLADRSALENAILNLALNARDAMPDGGAVKLTAVNINAGKEVCISLKDTGTGMTPRVRARAFDPLFTTKPPGRGTGLGLATVYGFAKQSGGTATIESTPGQGTTVSIILPGVAVSR
jgi:PAS domain S-box-containing protein